MINMENLTCRVMTEADIDAVVPIFVDYNNNHEDCEWTNELAYKRIHQVVNREDSYCLILESGEKVIGFVIGFFEQYYDLIAYDLWEILIAYEYQRQGIGTKFMKMIEQKVKEKGASLIQLISVNDEAHHKFYGNLGYGNSTNLILKNKVLQ